MKPILFLLLTANLTSIVGFAQARTEHTLPHIANGEFAGGRIRTTFAFFNGGSAAADVALGLSDDLGDELVVNIPEFGVGSRFRFPLAPNETRFLQTDGTGAPVAGSAVVNSDRPIGVSAIFSILDRSGRLITEAGVASSPALTEFAAAFDSTGSFQTGIALRNLAAEKIRVNFSLLDESGSPLGQAVREVPGGGHLSAFLTGADGLFPKVGEARGSLLVAGSGEVAAIALRQQDLVLTTLPIAPRGDDRTYFVLPQVANGGGVIDTTFIFFNEAAESADVWLSLSNDEGQPLPLTLTDGDRGSLFVFQMAPGSSRFIKTDGQGDLTTGAARVLSSAPIAASAVFSIRDRRGNLVTEAGVGDSSQVRSFALPVDLTENFDTGFAFFNANTKPARLELELILSEAAPQDSAKVGQGAATVTIEIGPGGHDSRFVSELFPGAGKRGILRGSSGAPISVLSLRQERATGIITTLPVVPLAAGGDPGEPDPCEQISEPCQSARFGPVFTISARSQDGISTVVSDESGEIAALDWRESGEQAEVVVTFPGQPPLSPSVLEGGLPSLEEANSTASIVVLLNASIDEDKAPAGSFLVSPLNRAGCDFINSLPFIGSCSRNGACCDGHDVCIDKFCTGPNDSGNLVVCALRDAALFTCLDFCRGAIGRFVPGCEARCRERIRRCSEQCNACHVAAILCYAIFDPGPSQCCDEGDAESVCGQPQQCILNNKVITDPCVCDANWLGHPDDCEACLQTNTCHGDPTFIQRSSTDPDGSSVQPPDAGQDLIAKITVPYPNALVRADVPIFGVASGENFKSYRIEVGEGTAPARWKTVAVSETPHSDARIGDLAGKGDRSIRGNLATWDTGLTNYVYPPSHPKGHPVDLHGTHTIRLIVTARDGKTVEDRVTVGVGHVIPNAWGGEASSGDGRVRLSVPEQALMDAFRVIMIDPAPNRTVAPSSGRKPIGAAYSFREPGERFTKKARLKFSFSPDEIGGTEPERLGIYAYDARAERWRHLDSRLHANGNAVVAEVAELAPFYALMASEAPGEGCVAPLEAVQAPPKLSSQIEAGRRPVQDDFEEGFGQWSNRDGAVGGTVELDNNVTPDQTNALKITNRQAGGNFAVNVRRAPFDAREYRLVEFDYRIPPEVKINFLVRVAGRWYEIGFTDDVKDYRNQRVNIAYLGAIEGIVADGRWRTARFDLYEMLRRATGHSLVEQMIMADWDLSGFMRLHFGRNPAGASFHIDNFSIGRETPSVPKALDDPLVVDDFDETASRNGVSEGRDLFSDGVGRVEATLEAEEGSDRGSHLALSYDVSHPRSFAGYVAFLPRLDLGDYQSLSFQIRGEESSQDLVVGMKDESGSESKVPLSRYLPEKIKTRWQEVSLPLTVLSEGIDRSAVVGLSLAFEHSLGSAGSVFIDRIEFGRELSDVLIEDFASAGDRNLLGGERWTFSHGAAAIKAEKTASGDDHVLGISFGGNIGEACPDDDEDNYAGWSTQLRGVDCSACETLSLRIRGAQGGERPNIYLDDGNFRWGVDVEEYLPITRDWQHVVIPLSDFADLGVDLSHLSQLQIVFEWDLMSGTVYIDDIRFGEARN